MLVLLQRKNLQGGFKIPLTLHNNTADVSQKVEQERKLSLVVIKPFKSFILRLLSGFVLCKLRMQLLRNWKQELSPGRFLIQDK